MWLFIQVPTPIQIIWQVFSCAPLESLYPTLQTTVISIDILNLIDLIWHSATGPRSNSYVLFLHAIIRSISLVHVVAKERILRKIGLNTCLTKIRLRSRSTTSIIAPWRNQSIRRRICSFDKPPLVALSVRLWVTRGSFANVWMISKRKSYQLRLFPWDSDVFLCPLV